jgi:hypothetical protein
VRPRVYLETSVVSYLTAPPSRDLIRAAHQQITVEWWAAAPIICTPEELHQKKEDA